ncbi:MAG: hypothetical protein J3R72DRAFT_35511 [Linnemannia gamsii]|nr:MAG: hypothetical protein J3R72DRAFT_35511 [Linnemannia gamsii]
MISTRVLTFLVASLVLLISVQALPVPVKHNIVSVQACESLCSDQDVSCQHANIQAMGHLHFDCASFHSQCKTTCRDQFGSVAQ